MIDAVGVCSRRKVRMHEKSSNRPEAPARQTHVNGKESDQKSTILAIQGKRGSVEASMRAVDPETRVDIVARKVMDRDRCHLADEDMMAGLNALKHPVFTRKKELREDSGQFSASLRYSVITQTAPRPASRAGLGLDPGRMSAWSFRLPGKSKSSCRKYSPPGAGGAGVQCATLTREIANELTTIKAVRSCDSAHKACKNQSEGNARQLATQRLSLMPSELKTARMFESAKNVTSG